MNWFITLLSFYNLIITVLYIWISIVWGHLGANVLVTALLCCRFVPMSWNIASHSWCRVPLPFSMLCASSPQVCQKPLTEMDPGKVSLILSLCIWGSTLLWLWQALVGSSKMWFFSLCNYGKILNQLFKKEWWGSTIVRPVDRLGSSRE